MQNHNQIIEAQNAECLDEFQKKADLKFIERLEKLQTFGERYSSTLKGKDLVDSMKSETRIYNDSVYEAMFARNRVEVSDLTINGHRPSFCVIDDLVARPVSMSFPIEITPESRVAMDEWLSSEIRPVFIPMCAEDVDEAVERIHKALRASSPIAVAGYFPPPAYDTIVIDSLTSLDRLPVGLEERGITIEARKGFAAMCSGAINDMIIEQINFGCSLQPTPEQIMELSIPEFEIPRIEKLDSNNFKNRSGKEKYQFGKYIKRKHRG